MKKEIKKMDPIVKVNKEIAKEVQDLKECDTCNQKAEVSDTVYIILTKFGIRASFKTKKRLSGFINSNPLTGMEANVWLSTSNGAKKLGHISNFK